MLSPSLLFLLLVAERPVCPATMNGHKFLRPSLYNGTPGKEEYELAPDDTRTQGTAVRQTWKLSDYRSMNLFARCRYSGTSATVTADLPAKMNTCTFSFVHDPAKGEISSPAFECR